MVYPSVSLQLRRGARLERRGGIKHPVSATLPPHFRVGWSASGTPTRSNLGHLPTSTPGCVKAENIEISGETPGELPDGRLLFSPPKENDIISSGVWPNQTP
jgi:hypothetical protein